jgi:hypothetical protein
MKISFVIILAIVFGFTVSAQKNSDLPKSQQPQSATKNQSVQTSSQTSIVFEKTTHDYGTIGQGADGNCEFKFTNTGQAPLILSNVAASCGCTVPDWPHEPIVPGTSGSIKVKYNTALLGVFNKSITVNSNAAANPVVLQIKGDVTAPKNQATQAQNTAAALPQSSVSKPSTTNNPTAPTIKNAAQMNSSQTRSTVSPTSGTKPRLNPAHGEPYHRCDIAVGAPLDSPLASTSRQTTNNQVQATAPQSSVSKPSKMNNPTAPTIENAMRMNPSQPRSATGAKPSINPPHGQPFHRCDIAVGSPLP